MNGYKRLSLTIWIYLAGGLVAVVLYLAAYGPIYGIHRNGVMLKESFLKLTSVAYYPMFFIDEKTEFFNDHPIGIAYFNYLDSFREKPPPALTPPPLPPTISP